MYSPGSLNIEAKPFVETLNIPSVVIFSGNAIRVISCNGIHTLDIKVNNPVSKADGISIINFLYKKLSSGKSSNAPFVICPSGVSGSKNVPLTPLSASLRIKAMLSST